MKKIALTRPLKDTEIVAKDIAALGHNVVIAPLIDIVPCCALPCYSHLLEADYLVISSANVAIGLRQYKTQELTSLYSKSVFAIGPMSAEAMRNLGFTQIYVAHSTIDSVVALIRNWHSKQKGYSQLRGVYLSGVHVAHNVSLLLRQAGLVCDRHAIYNARAVCTLPSDLHNCLQDRSLEAIVFYSSRTAQIFFTCARQCELHKNLNMLKYLCLSSNISESVLIWGKECGHELSQIYVAQNASNESMIALIRDNLV